jgi:hypothetical protein
VHRFLEANGIECHVVDAASIAVNPCSRRAKTDRVDVEKLLDTRIECSMVRPGPVNTSGLDFLAFQIDQVQYPRAFNQIARRKPSRIP